MKNEIVQLLRVILLIMLCFVLVFMETAKADHALGGSITYTYKKDSVYEITFDLYRSCSGVPINPTDVEFRFYCAGTNTILKLVPQRKSITDITPLCPTATTSPCGWGNQNKSGYGIEVHRYSTTVDFKISAYSSLYGCSDLSIEVTTCCRANNITVGNYALYIDIPFKPKANLSSPMANHNVSTWLAVNQPAVIDFGAEDVDGDKLSYQLVAPKRNRTWTITYPTNYSLNKPISYYGTLNDPYDSIPSGFSLDTNSGKLVCTPEFKEPERCGLSLRCNGYHWDNNHGLNPGLVYAIQRYKGQTQERCSKVL